jgi:hypothetical protein
MGRGLRSVCEYKLVVNCDSRFCRLHVRIELRESFQMVAVWKTCVLKESRMYLRCRPETVGFREPKLPILSKPVSTAHITTRLTGLASA